MRKIRGKMLAAMATLALAAGLSLPGLAFASDTIAVVEDQDGEYTEHADLQDAFDYVATLGDSDPETGEYAYVYIYDDIDLGESYLTVSGSENLSVYLFMDGYTITSDSSLCTIKVEDGVYLQIDNGVVANHAASGKAVVDNFGSFYLGSPDFGDETVPPASLVAGEGVDCAILNQPGASFDIDNGIVKGGDYAIINYGHAWINDAIITGDVVTDDLVEGDDITADLVFFDVTLNGGIVGDNGNDEVGVGINGGRFAFDPTEWVDLEYGDYDVFGPTDGYYVVSQRQFYAIEDCLRDEDCQLAYYEDTNPKAWYHDGLEWANALGIITGYTEPDEFIPTKLGPTDPVTREQFAVMMYRYASERQFDMSVGDFYALDFKDADKVSSWAQESMQWACETGILRGYDDGTNTVGPKDTLTREQLAVMLYRFAEYAVMDTSAGENTNLLSYEDANKIGDFAMESMRWAVGEGIITGYTENGEPTGYLGPKDDCERAMVGTMLMRLYYL